MRAHSNGTKLRPVGSALSPNGLAFNEDGAELVNLALMDKIIYCDPLSRRVKVEAGAKVSHVVESLRPFGLTLQNFASINSQQLGGLYQAGAHGTGISIPPSDCQVVAMTIVTPAKGTLRLCADDPDEEMRQLFFLTRVGLGCCGIVADVTIQCVSEHLLLETTQVLTRSQVWSFTWKIHFFNSCFRLQLAIGSGSGRFNTFVTCGFRIQIVLWL